MHLSRARQILLDNLATARLRPQGADEWTGPFALPDPVLAFYGEVGPVDLEIEGYGNAWTVPSLARLWELQGGYRYHPRTKERLPGWRDEWLVVASEGGDPYVFDAASSRVLYGLHGGSWTFHPVFGSLGEMIAVFGALGGLVSRVGYEHLTDDDCNVKAEHLREARDALSRVLGARERADAMLRSLGWQ